ncbi:hypothetical protein K505DRAFT_261687, partial [Melanomma pulvis-pyrius CBS 109.77]
FKVAEPAHIEEAIKRYSTLSQDAKKSGTPYIITASASPTHSDPRSQGYTLVVRTVFESKDDMDYYDNECAAHVEIKAMFKGKLGGPPLMVYMDMER